MTHKILSISDISSIYGETTERFLEGMLSYKECIEFLAIINSIENELLPQISDIDAQINIKRYINRIKLSEYYEETFTLLKSKSTLSKKEQSLIDKSSYKKKITTEKNLYVRLIKYCKKIITKFNCNCEKAQNFQIDISNCEQLYSRFCKDYDCEVLPHMYVLKRADRHCSELVYALDSIEKNTSRYE